MTTQVRKLGTGFRDVAPFLVCFLFAPILVLSFAWGGWWLLLSPIYGYYLSVALDYFQGKDKENVDPNSPEEALTPYKLITLIWAPIQIGLILWSVWYVSGAAHLALHEKILAMIGLGVATGGVGIVFAHELMHQKTRLERWAADLLMTSVLYGHFRSEHMLVHHRYIGTPRDPVTARYNENFHRFFWRVVPACFLSALRAEADRLNRKGKSAFDLSNPFWIYAGLQLGFLTLSVLLGGWLGLGMFLIQAFIAIGQLELINFIEHYGLTREHLGDGKYEHVKPHHSWNTDFRFTNMLLINLQRHSDHHYKPSRPFPLLQTYGKDEAPQLPMSYPFMCGLALIPPLFRWRMNPKVDRWRAKFYPHITDWTPYNEGSNPLPR
ncbi:MAG: alkane 1-monooxygenase [Pseudomonadota bacterium]